MHDDFECFAGIDWATEAHQVCLMDRAGVILGERSFAHSGAGLAALCDWLVAPGAAPPTAIAVAIGVPHGAVVDSLLERGFAAFSVNPKQLDRFVDRFTLAGAKGDRSDGYVLGDSLRTDRHCFRRLEAGTPALVELSEWSRMAEELGQERARLANRLREQLRRYCPQALEGVGKTALDHPEPMIGRVTFMDALGTRDGDFLGGLLEQLVNAGTQGQEPDEAGVNFMLSVVKGVEPKDQVEAMLAAQMAAVHMATMRFARRLANVDNIPQQDSAERAFNKLARTFAAQMEALKRYRTGGQQRVTVEHVTVNEGGQAIVGNVVLGGGSSKNKEAFS